MSLQRISLRVIACLTAAIPVIAQPVIAQEGENPFKPFDVEASEERLLTQPVWRGSVHFYRMAHAARGVNQAAPSPTRVDGRDPCGHRGHECPR